MATLGLDTSVYKQGVEEAKAQTKTAVASMTKDYNRLYSDVLHLTAAYQKSSKETGENSKRTKELKEAQAQLNATAQGLRTAEQYMGSFSESTKTAGESLTAAFTKSQVLSSAITKLGTAALNGAKSLVTTGIEYNAQIEKYTTGLTNMLGSAEAAQSAMEAIQADAARTPFDVSTLTQANQLLISAGENAGYSRKVIMALGDAVSATGGGNVELSRMAANLQQIANVGKASAVDIKQFAYAGINIYQVLADYTGKSVQEVQNMTISYGLLSEALIAASEEGGRYYQSMETQSQTMEGRVSTLKDNVSQLAGALTEDLSGAYGNLITYANDMAVAMKEGFQTDGIVGMAKAASEADPKLSGLSQAVQFCSENSGTLKIVLGTVAGAILTYKTGTVLATTAQLALNAAMSANPIGLVVAGLGALAGGLVTAYNTNETFRGSVDNLKTSFDHLKGSIRNATNELLGYKAAQTDAEGFGGSSGGEFYETLPTSKVTDEERDRRKNLHDQRVRKSQLEKIVSSLADNGPDSGPTGSSGKKASSTASKAETVVSSVSHIATTAAQNELGTVETSITSLVEKVKDASGNIRDRLTETRTETGKELVDGIATTYKLVETKVDGNVTKTVKTYEDMSKVLSGTLTTVAESTFNGITTNVQKAVETYADGSKHIKETQTETGTRIVDGAEQTYTKVITFVDGIQDKVTETANLIDKSVKGTQTRIDQYLSDAKSKWSDGIFGTLQSTFSDLKNGNWSSLALDVTKLIWGEVSQGQREVLSKWANDSLDVINEAYEGNGLKGAYSTLQKLLTDGVTATEGGSTTSVKGLQSLFQNLNISGNAGEQLAEISEQAGRATMSVGSFKASLDALNKSGGITSKLSGIAGGFSGMSSSIVSSLGTIVSTIAANPILAAILGVTALAGGIGIAAWSRSRKSKDSYTSDYESPFDKTQIYDSLKEFEYRSEELKSLQRAGSPTSYSDAQSGTGLKQLNALEHISAALDEHLPAIGTGQVVFDTGAVAGELIPAMTGGMDQRLGISALRKARGN